MNDSDEVIRARLEMTAIRDRDLDREIGVDWQIINCRFRLKSIGAPARHSENRKPAARNQLFAMQAANAPVFCLMKDARPGVKAESA